MDSTAIALVPSSDLEEMKPAVVLCQDCNKPATRSDGKCALHSGFRMSTKARQKAAREMVQRDSLKYARMLRDGAARAAAKGDTEPAQWALLHSGALEPVATKQNTTQVGVQVYVGTVLPGLREDK